MPLNSKRKRRKMQLVQSEMTTRMGAAKQHQNEASMAVCEGNFRTAADEVHKAERLLRSAQLDLLELHRLQGQGDSENGTTPED